MEGVVQAASGSTLYCIRGVFRRASHGGGHSVARYPGSSPQEREVAVSYFGRVGDIARETRAKIVERVRSAGGPRIPVGRHPLLLGRILGFSRSRLRRSLPD